jgi:hypothetical protein
MARLLSCPHCRADFGFEQWALATSCPACGLRLSFFEASGQAAPAPTSAPPSAAAWAAAQPFAPASPAAPTAAGAAAAVPGGEPGAPQSGGWTWSAPVAPPSVGLAPAAAPAPAVGLAPAVAVTAVAAARRHVYTIGGKALEWSTGWTVVLVILAIVAVGLAVTRVEMGRLTLMTPAESAAIAAVQRIKLPTGASTEAVLRYSATHDLTLEGHVAKIPAGGTQMWYAFNRSWEHRIYVYTELPGGSMIGKNAVLSWSVSNGVATADGATRAVLAKAAQTMAHPPSPNSVPAVPGIIPSLPPDLQ